MLKGVKWALVILALLFLANELRDLTSLIKRQKYDLDMCIVVDGADMDANDAGLAIKGLPTFAPGTYKIYGFGNSTKKLVQYFNQDASEADYFIPFDAGKMRYDAKAKTLDYNDRTYGRGEFEVYQADPSCLDGCAIVQLIQPPPSGKIFHYLDFVQLAQVVTVLIAIVLYFAESKKELQIARRNTYLSIETEANSVFRFEFENSKDLYWIYDEGGSGENLKNPERVWACQEYLCQILNLFEIAIELRSTGHLTNEVYNTWVRWFWDVSSAKHFGAFWGDLAENYTGGLKAIMADGVQLAEETRKKNEGASPEAVAAALSLVGQKTFLPKHMEKTQAAWRAKACAWLDQFSS